MSSPGGRACPGLNAVIRSVVRTADLTFGFDTAVSIATEMIDRLPTTASRTSGCCWSRSWGGTPGGSRCTPGWRPGAHVTLVPGEPFDVDEVSRLVEARFERGDTHVIGVVAEGAAAPPTSFDRVLLATRFGLHATVPTHEGAHGSMVALRGTEIELVPLARAVARLKTVTPSRLAETGAFTG